MNAHICITNSLRVGMEDMPPMECWLCGQKTMRLDSAGGRCDTCGADVEDVCWSIGAARRKARIRRQDFAQALGVMPATVSNYEYGCASRTHIEKCRIYFKEHYAS